MEDHSPSPPVPTDIPEDAVNAKVPLDALYQVLHHGENASGDSHRFSVSADPEDATSRVSGDVVWERLDKLNITLKMFYVDIHTQARILINCIGSFEIRWNDDIVP